MKMMLLAIVAMLGVTSARAALTLSEKKQQSKWVEELKDSPDSSYERAKKTCGYEIPAKFDESLIKPFMKADKNLAGYCDAARNQIASMCEDATSKDAIKAKVKSISCHMAKKSDDISFKLTGTTLDVTFGVESSNIEDKTKEFLENNL